jgi:hypothetical protein
VKIPIPALPQRGRGRTFPKAATAKKINRLRQKRKRNFLENIFGKPIDFSKRLCYNITVAEA